MSSIAIENLKRNYLSEMVFSRSINAPPHMKRISFVSICKKIEKIQDNNIIEGIPKLKYFELMIQKE